MRIEQVFGICEADGKNGIEGSKIIHPSSRFYAGTLAFISIPRPPPSPALLVSIQLPTLDPFLFLMT